MISKEDATCQNKPQIDKGSSKIAEKLFKELNDPPHIRLFKKKEKNLIKKERVIKTNKLKIDPKKETKKIKGFMGQKFSPKVKGRSITTLYNDAKQKEDRLKNLRTKIETNGFQPDFPASYFKFSHTSVTNFFSC